jgi:hypothetical protein
MNLRSILLGILLGIATFGKTQSWQVVNPTNVEVKGIRDVEPQIATVYFTNDDEIRTLLWSAEKEVNRDVNESSLIINVGLPNKETESFRIVQYDMMEAEIAAKYADIRTFYGVGTHNKLKRIRIDYTYHGFRAVISAPGEDKVFIDHFQRNDKNTRIVYYKKDYKKVPSWGCHVTDEHNLDRGSAPGSRIGDCQLRSYRLAQATTGEYSNYHGATSVAQSGLVMTAVVNVINRINEVYEPEVAVRMILVNNTDQIFYYTPSTDPYTNNNGSTMLGENINTCNTVIGSTNYDIGHVFSTGGGGVAYLGSVCGSNKAGGVTGQAAPIGDPFTIDYVAHEMGHQFGGSHTQYNSCNRSNANAMEPGSASTIMGYAGICSPNVQNNSDAYFHARSLDQMKTFLLAGGNACATIVSLPANNVPTITAVPNYSIPVSTPFILTLSATDPNGHDMTYAWEQMNSYSAPAQTMPPVSTNTTGPMFRSIFATTTPSRYFPPLENIINNTSNTWQVLPSVARSMSFRGVVRDWTGVFGCNNEVNITVSTVNAAAGAFSVTSFNTASTWNVGDNKTITWNVAGTTASPVSAANVDILFSTDGGNTFPITLASSTPNDGTHSIVVPNNTTTQGRIMVRGSNHIFFDLNNANITVTGVPSTYTLNATPSSFNVCPETSVVSTINVVPTGGFNAPVTLSISGLPAGANANFTVNPVTPGNSSVVTITGLTTSGNYTININGLGGSQSKTTPLNVIILPLPSLVNQLLPTNQATNVSLTPILSWSALAGAISYDFEVAYDEEFTEMIATYNGTATSFQINDPIFGGTTLYWRVKAINNCGPGDWSQRSFTVEPCYFYAPSDLPLDLPFGLDTKYSNLDIKDKGIVTDVNILSFSGNYSGVTALRFTMISPTNNTSIFWDSPCDREQSFNIQFDDSATTTWPCPPTTGLTYIPSNPLNNLNTTALKGNWQLKVDRTDAGPGQVSSWGMKACANNFCRLTVDHTRKDGPGSLKEAINCASTGDTIRFNNLVNNDTIFLGNQSLIVNKSVYIEGDITNNIHIMSDSPTALFQNLTPVSTKGLKIKGLHIHSSNNNVGAIINSGRLTLEDVTLHKWSGTAQSTITNEAGGILELLGECKIVE